MRGDQGVQLTTDDDNFHSPTSDDPMWSETTWFSISVPERRIHAYVYPWVRPNMKMFGGGVIVWDDSGALPWDSLHCNYQWNLPLAALGDLRDFEFPLRIRVRCLEPLTTYHVTYDHPDCSIDVQFRAIVEPHVRGRGDPPGLFSAHVDQPGHVTGRITLAGEEIPVDCYAMRDRSWGPRIEDPTLRMGYDHAQCASSAFLAFSLPDAAGAPVVMGYLWRDGEAAALVSGTREIERDGVWPRRIVISAVDALGRRIEAVGQCVNRFSFTNIPWMFNWLSLTRWEYEGSDGAAAVGWGEVQDVWHTDRYRAFARSLRQR